MGGIYEEKRKATDDVSKMLDFAIEAKNAGSIAADFGSFRFYDDRLQENREQSEYIEMHMDTALENNNFVVFYQPKINLITDLPDGCEALVRWYNPELDEYMRPGVFMPLFEANGFIVKLDKYVYEQVCSYIEESTLQRQPLYPVSVNVSRATAIQDGFVDFYVSRKKKHNIIDGFLTIEFTESFAYENYDKMREIINQLHRNGFKCSIDDFGTGFSSYNILKEIQMDEIKLDRFFIDKGISEERDRKILESVINLSKDLRMKVTQEGVETEEQRDMMRKLGCQVIQGYFYSKPLHLSDYIGFIEKYSHAGKR
jgi:EAL domain-containing protein (putative c-di-GMP-specific phosphodiesterase class I)